MNPAAFRSPGLLRRGRGHRRWCGALATALLAGSLLASPAASASGWTWDGTKTLSVHLADGSRLVLGQVRFTPRGDGSAGFAVTLRHEVLVDHFLSMREFKCLTAPQEITCHVPYPHAHPGTAGPGQLGWLEHSLLFFHKAPADFGAKLWNGVLFELRETPTGLVGTPRAVDLNQIATPPADARRPPFGAAQRHDMPASARWVRSLVIE